MPPQRLHRKAAGLLLLPALLALAASEASDTKCQGLGFSAEVDCADCQRLEDIVGDAELTADCRACCRESQAAATRFDRAALEVCKHRLREFPGVQDFLENHAARFPALRVRYRFGAPPRLDLHAHAGAQESLRVDMWRSDNIVEFLVDKMGAAAQLPRSDS